MNNEYIYDIIAKLLMGTISGEEQAVLDAWLDESEANRRVFGQFMQCTDMAEMYRTVKSVEKSEKKTLQDRPEKQGLSKRMRMAGIAAAAASVVLAAGLYMWHSYVEVVAPELDQQTLAVVTAAEKGGRAGANMIIYDDRGEEVEAMEQVQNQVLGGIYDMVKTKFATDDIDYTATVSTEGDKEFWMTLSDGTRVHLNNNSTLTYPVVFRGNAREVTLNGEAYFAVAKDRRHPFIVHTQYGDVKEYGTEFVVNTSYDSNETTASEGITGRGMSVVLVEGSISITPKNGAEHMMVPNELAVIPTGGKSCLMKTVDTAPFASWNTGTFSFDGCPMEALMDVIGKWYKLDVEYAHDGYRKIQFTGELDRYDGIEDDLNAINQITGMDLKVVGDKIIVE